MLHIVVSVVARYSTCVKWGHNLCVWVPPPILMSTGSCPLCAEPGPEGKCAHAQGRVDVMYRTHEKLSHYIYVVCFLKYFSQLLLRVFTLPTFPYMQFGICFGLFSNVIHVVK